MAVGNCALAFLSDMILNIHDVWPILNVVNATTTRQNGVGHVPRGRELRRDRSQLLPPLPISLRCIAGDVNQTQVKARMTHVVDRHAPRKRLAPFFRRRSEERRVGKECRSWLSSDPVTQNKMKR